MFLQVGILDRFFEATECSPVTIILALGIVVLLWVAGKLYFRNTSLSNHIMESDKNNAIIMTEVKAMLENILDDDKNNADKILTSLDNIKDHVRNKNK